jgi:TolB protein
MKTEIVFVFGLAFGGCVPPGYLSPMGGGGGGTSTGTSGPAQPAPAPPPPEELATTGAAGQLARLTEDPRNEYMPRLSPDGKSLLYAVDTHEYVDGQDTGTVTAIHVMRSRPDGRSAIALTAESGWAWSPSWLPNSASYVMVSTAMGGSDIVRALRVGFGAAVSRVLAEREAKASMLAVSPSGEVIAFQSEVGGKTMIGTVKVNGSELTHLVAGTHPAWSPDGRHLAFVQPDNVHIAVTDPDGGELTQLTDGEDAVGGPSWSPDGAYIAFTSNRGWRRFSNGAEVNHNLFVMRADGTGLVQLTEGKHWLINPWWGSDGFIYFSANNNGGTLDLWRLRPDLAALRPSP